jgi:hypothetical protein
LAKHIERPNDGRLAAKLSRQWNLKAAVREVQVLVGDGKTSVDPLAINFDANNVGVWVYLGKSGKKLNRSYRAGTEA